MEDPPAPAIRSASCRCGQVTATCAGEPVRVSVCHCLDCQRRSGSAFAAQARWPAARVRITGRTNEWSCVAESGNRATFRFCPDCGSTIAFCGEGVPGTVAVPIGAFADPAFPAPGFSIYEKRCHPWVRIAGDGIEHD